MPPSTRPTAGSRPAPDMIEETMRRTGVTDPGAVLVAGDTVLDVQAGLAAKAGIVVGVLSGAQTRAELAAEHSTHVLGSVAEVPALLGMSG